MRFLIHPKSSFSLDDWQEAHWAYFGGREGAVFPTTIELDDNILICHRQPAGSGRLHLSYPVEGFGSPLLCTSSLREQEEPYLLSLELARGKIAQVRDQISEWDIAQKEICKKARIACREAQQHFAFAASHQNQFDAACEAAELALQKACLAADFLVQCYAHHEISVTQQQTHHPLALFAGSMGDFAPDETWGEQFRQVFHQANVPLSWKEIETKQGKRCWDIADAQVEWCMQHRLLMRGGPLLDFSPEGLPSWLENWSDDLTNLQSLICDYIESAISRYFGKIRTWEVCARGNTGGALGLSEEARLTLVAHTLEVARRVNDEIQLVIGINQPWGEYQAREKHYLAPLQFVDALLRSGVGLSAVNLELPIGYEAGGCANRGLLDFSRMLDLWSCLGIPLHVTLAVPSCSSADSFARSKGDVNNNQWRDGWTNETQAEWIQHYLPLLIAKPAVVSVEWAHFSDAQPHCFPHAGLLQSDGKPKPAYHFLVDYKNKS